MLAENAAYLTYKACEGTPSTSKIVNVVIAAYVTAMGRIKLWELLNTLGSSLLYCDTDSAIFVLREGDKMPPIGSYLGDLTNEISDAYGNDARGVNFVSTGPKSYALQIERPGPDGEMELINIVKSKGFTLKGAAREIITFETYEKLVLGEIDEVVVPTTTFKAQKDGNVQLLESYKRLRKTFDKRRIVDNVNYDSVPWGYID